MNKLWYKAFLYWIFFSSFFIAACTVCLFLFFNPSSTLYKSLILFCGTFIAYNFLKYRGAGNEYLEGNSEQIKWVKIHERHLLLMVILATIILFYSWYQLNFRINSNWIFAFLFLGFYGIFRLMKLFPDFNPGFHAFMKIFNVALVWSLVVIDFSSSNFFCFSAVFFLVSGLMIPFEIKDMKHDKPHAVATIPLLYSVQKTKWIGFVMLLFSGLLMLLTDLVSAQKVSWICATAIGALSIFFSSERRTELYYLSVVDGVMFIPLLFYTFISLCAA
jgi:4-hydroxybenzoate polyprenyltransferase